ncbi:MAG TPA: hypothetical protein VIJ04_22560 [Xanthobacteraceae bacterium]
MRNALRGVAILAGLFLAPAVGSHDRSSASAKDDSTRIENAPCVWFSELFPGAWGTDHKIMINPQTVIAKASFGRGTFTLVDGTDAFEYLERKCGEN